MQPSARSSSVGIPAMAICIFAVYISSLSPSIAGGDSGELVAEGCALGTAHPPGYPLFTLMVFLIKLCADPLGIEVAYGVNVSSAILTVGAACLIGQVVSRAGCTGGTLPGVLLSMGMFSFSPLIWQYATTAEVFPLNTFFMALLVYLVVQFEYDRREWIVRSGALLCGVALCNQHTAVLYEAPLILWILYLHREKIKATPSLLAVYSLLFVAGLAIYGYLPIAANIVDSPGGWGDVKTLKGIIHHMLRRDYGTFQLYSGNSGKQAESMIERTVAYLEDLHSMQGLCVAPILAFVGVVYWARSVPAGLEHAKIGEGAEPGSNAKRVASCRAALHKPSLTLARDMGQYTPTIIAATQVFYFVVFHSLSNLPLSDKLLYGIHQRFWMQPNVVTFIWVGIGFNACLSAFKRAASSKNFFQNFQTIIGLRKETKSSTDKLPPLESNSGCDSIIFFVGILVALGLVLAQCSRFYWIEDQYENKFFHNYAKALIEPLPQNAVLLVNYDMQWTAIRYMQKCIGLRPDITAINLSMMTFAWFKNNHHHYPNIVFPGTFYSSSSTVAVSNPNMPFSMFQFLEANVNSLHRINGTMGGIFLCGKLNFPDKRVTEAYETIPYGLTQTFVRRNSNEALLSPSIFQRQNQVNWKIVTSALPILPNKVKFDEHTWEWTIGRDFADRVLDIAAYLLEQSIPLTATDSAPLQDAIYWLEVSLRMEMSFIPSNGGPPRAPTSLLKNAGLAHAHLVQSKTVVEGEALGEFSLPSSAAADVFSLVLLGGEPIYWPIDARGKEWSANLFVRYWGEFLQREDAKNDPQYKTILSMYEQATKKSTRANKAINSETAKPATKKTKA